MFFLYFYLDCLGFLYAYSNIVKTTLEKTEESNFVVRTVKQTEKIDFKLQKIDC